MKNRAVPFATITAILIGCAPPPRCPEASPPAPAKEAAPPKEATPAGPRLSIAMKPHPGAPVDVSIRVSAEPAALATFSITPDGGAGALHLGAVEDDAGPLDVHVAAQAGGRVTVTPARAPKGEVRLAYSVEARPRAARGLPGVDPDPNRFLASGEPLLLLPDGLDDRTVHVSLRFDVDAYAIEDDRPARLDAASSFGVGVQREVDLRGSELRGGLYVAGTLGSAIFDTPEGHDEAAWLGYTSFDPRPIAADVAAFRTAVRETFGFGEETPLSLLILADTRAPGTFAVARRSRSVVVRVGAGEAWTGPVRIAVATEVLHAWIGGRLWIGPDDPAHEAEAAWFTEGVARHLARDLLFHFGLITSREVLDEVHGLFTAGMTSPWSRSPTSHVAAHVKEPMALPALIARGALYAAGLQRRVERRSQGKRGLVELLRPLFAKARERRGPLTNDAWLQAVSAELGEDERATWRKLVWEGMIEGLPDDALGPCFRAVPREYVGYDLGFDEDATRATADRKLVHLRAGGPADKAGLREGDVLVDAVIRRGRGDVPVAITVKRGDETKVVKYLPAGLRTKGTKGFARKADVPEEGCAR